MKKESVKKCECEACAGFKKLITQEISLHAFVGNCPPNFKCDVGEFQESLNYTNALHWDVGYSGEARYYNSVGIIQKHYDRASGEAIVENIKAPNAKKALFDTSKIRDIYKSKKIRMQAK